MGNEGSQKGYLFPDFSVRSEEIVNCRGGGQVNSSSWSYLIIFHQFQLWSERSYVPERTIDTRFPFEDNHVLFILV